jgi:hypothetical protein
MSGAPRSSAGMPFWKNRRPGPNRTMADSRHCRYQLLRVPMVEGRHHVAAHLQHEHGQREHRGHDQRALERGALARLALLRAILGRRPRGAAFPCRACAAAQRTRFIARLVHGRHQGRHIGAARQRHHRTFGGQIHAGRLHALHLFQRTLHAAHARGAGHALHLQLHAGLRHLVARLLYGGNGSRQVGRALEADAGLLGGQVDHGLLHARQLPERALHTAHAGGAGHALHGQVYGHAGPGRCIHCQLLVFSMGAL